MSERQGSMLQHEEDQHRAFSQPLWHFSEPSLDLRLKPDVATSRLRSAAIEEFPSQDVYRTEIARIIIDSERQEGVEVDPHHESPLV